MLDHAKNRQFIDQLWDDSIVPTLVEYIKIPNKSPAFDAAWAQHGYMDAAVELARKWCVDHAPKAATVEVVRLEGRTPLLLIEVPGQVDDTVMLYGHLDKQPEFDGWDDGLGPWTPVLRDGRLYGRGGADDGYACFGSLAALRSLEEQGVPLPRCVVLIETCEESGSYDLPAYIEHLAERIGEPSLVVCLDSGAGNYEQLWCTTSLRGVVVGDLRVSLTTEGVHSGDASGIVPSSFRVLRQLLDRLEDSKSGHILPEELYADIPAQRKKQAQRVAEVLEQRIFRDFPFREGVRPVDAPLDQLVLNRTWRPALEITGAAGLPALADAGNVMRPETAVKLSLRVPPTLPTERAMEILRRVLLVDPPYGARVTLERLEGGDGWDAPELADWLGSALEEASQTYFGAPAVYMGEGGSIPFMGMLGAKFPAAQFMITGVLGPKSNAHGPNEFLDIPTGKRVSACVAHVLAARSALRAK